MVHGNGLDPRTLTFSQAQGYEEIPGPLATGEISNEARIKLWDLLASSAWPFTWDLDINMPWFHLFRDMHRDFLGRPMDEFSGSGQKLAARYRTLILTELPVNKVFDLFQMIMRHPRRPRRFTADIARIFKECRLAYVVDTHGPATILPAATKEEGQTILRAIQELRGAGLQGAEAHLKKAGQLINESDWPGSVRESINAVESVARQLDPDASKTLGPALASLEKSGHLHPALKEAFSRLYGYTSDEQGIRHSLLENASSLAGHDEALFMLGACASFSSYLWRKHQQGSKP